MKRKLAGLLAAVMVLAMGMTAFAADSPNSNPYGVTSPTKNVAVSAATSTQTTAALSKAASVNKDSKVLAVVDVTYAGDIGNGVSIRLNVAGVKAGANIVLLHQVYVNGEWVWEQINPSEVGDGYVVAFFTSLSPVAVVELPANTAPGKPGTTPGTSPKTGYWE